MERENVTLEYKETLTRTYLKTVSAFANYVDGDIIFGITDGLEVKGVENFNEFALNLENQINDSIRPRPSFTIIPNYDGTVTLHVKKGKDTPYLYKSKAYKRSDSSTVEVDSIELKRLTMEGLNLSFDELKTADENLTFDTLKEELKKVTGIDTFNLDILKTLNLFSDGCYNNAAALLADNNSFCGIDIAVFGDDINEIKERITLSGKSVITQFLEAMNVFERVYTFEKVGAYERTTVEKIPREAFKEALANAIVHRTYDIKANTKVSMFKDCVEISSPGGLAFGITREQYVDGAYSVFRNPIIASVFMRLKIIEGFATGIRRIKNIYENLPEKPLICVDDYHISITLPDKKEKKKSSKDSKILDKMSENVKYSRSELEKLTGYSKDKIIREMNRLIDEEFICKEGEGKSTYYHIM